MANSRASQGDSIARSIVRSNGSRDRTCHNFATVFRCGRVARGICPLARLYRMSDRGDLVKSGRGLWRIAGVEDEEDEPVEPEPEPEPEDPARWVKPIGRFVRRDTSEFACRRYG